jgi:chromosome segregation ATPase
MLNTDLRNLADSPTQPLDMSDKLVPKNLPKKFWTNRKLALQVVGPMGTKDMMLDVPFARIGSHPDAELCLNGDNIERRHAYLQVAEDGIYCLNFVAGQAREKQTGFWVNSKQPVMIGDYQVFVRAVLPSGETVDVEMPRSEVDNARLPGTPPILSPIRSRKQPRYPIRDRFTCIGRVAGNRIRQSSTELSQFHCVVYRQDHQLWLIDLLTTNGSKINDEAVDVGRIPGPESKVLLATTPLRFILPPAKNNPKLKSLPETPTSGLDRARRQAVLEARDAALRAKFQELNYEREVCQRERDSLTQETARFLQQVAETETERLRSEQRFADWEQRLLARSRELEAINVSHAELQRQQQDLQRRQQEFEPQQAELAAKLFDFTQQQQESEQRLAAWEQELQARTSALEVQEIAQRELALRLAEFEQQKVEHEQQLQNFRQEQEVAEQRFLAWEQQLHDRADELETQQRAIAQQDERQSQAVEIIEQELVAVRNQNAELVDQLQRTQSEMSQFQTQQVRWQEREKEFVKAVAELQSRLDEAERHFELERREWESRRSTESTLVSNLRGEIEQWRARVASMDAGTLAELEQIQQAKSELDIAVAAAAQREHHVANLERELAQRESELRKSQKHLEQARLYFEREQLIHGSQVKVLARLGQLQSRKTWWYRLLHPFHRS